MCRPPSVWGCGGDGGVVGVGYRLHDREAQPEALGVAGAVGGERLERPEQPLELAERDGRAAVVDGDDGPVVADFGARASMWPCGDVVAGGVADQVGDEPLDEPRVAARLCRLEVGGDREAVVSGRWPLRRR